MAVGQVAGTAVNGSNWVQPVGYPQGFCGIQGQHHDAPHAGGRPGFRVPVGFLVGKCCQQVSRYAGFLLGRPEQIDVVRQPVFNPPVQGPQIDKVEVANVGVVEVFHPAQGFVTFLAVHPLPRVCCQLV